MFPGATPVVRACHGCAKPGQRVWACLLALERGPQSNLEGQKTVPMFEVCLTASSCCKWQEIELQNRCRQWHAQPRRQWNIWTRKDFVWTPKYSFRSLFDLSCILWLRGEKGVCFVALSWASKEEVFLCHKPIWGAEYFKPQTCLILDMPAVLRRQRPGLTICFVEQLGASLGALQTKYIFSWHSVNLLERLWMLLCTRPSTWLKKLVWCSAIQGTKGAACPNNGLPTLHRLDVLHLGNLTTSALASCSARSTGISFPRTKVRLEKNADWGVTNTTVIFLWTLHQTNIPCSWWKMKVVIASLTLQSFVVLFFDRKSAWITCRKLLQTASFSSLQQSRISAAFLYGFAAGLSPLSLRTGFL